jgi:CRISPR-associated protein (Cas_Cmr3)
MSESYLVTFKPAGRYFFGTSQSFAEGFHAISSFLPGQTTVLGTLRYTLLKVGKLLDHSHRYPRGMDDEVKRLTGECNMKNISDRVENDNYFGIIRKISPLFVCLQPEGCRFPFDFYFPAPNDIIYIRSKTKRDEDGDLEIIGIEKLMFEMKGVNGQTLYSAAKITKEQPADCIGGSEFWDSYLNNKPLSLNTICQNKNIFYQSSQYGIQRGEGRDDKRKKKEEGIYFKRDFMLNKDFSFGVIVHFSEAPPYSQEDVFLGGEKSLFKMTVTKIDGNNKGAAEGHPLLKTMLNPDFYGDFDGTQIVSAGGDDAFTFLSQFFGEGSLHGVKHSIVEERSTPRMLSKTSIKTDSYTVIPSRSIIYAFPSLSIENVFKIPRLIGYNFVLKYKLRS